MTRVNNFILFSLAFLLIFSCKKGNIMHEDELNLKDWNKSTISYLNHECKIMMDSIRLGEYNIPVKYDTLILHTTIDYLKFCFDFREELIQYLNSKVTVEEDLKIFENYSNWTASFIVQVDKSEILNFKNLNGNLVLISHEYIKSELPLFENNQVKESNCFTKYTGLPQRFWIFSNYTLKEKKLDITHVSMMN